MSDDEIVGRLIPCRVRQSMINVTVHNRVYTLAPDHPMVMDPCQVCGRLLGDHKPVVGVVLGIAPEDRLTSGDGWVNAAMAIVHDECAGPGRFAAV
jgi:hypothetical protein